MASSEPTLTTRTGRVRRARRLATRRFRAETGQFLAEGPQAVREALALTGVTHEVFATAAATERHGALHDAALDGEVPWSVIDDDVLAEIADATTPQGVVAVCDTVVRGLDALPAAPRLVVVCHDMRDPGNAGAVLRCADAAGADMVERGLQPELGRSGHGAGQGADEKVAYGVRRGVLAGGGGGGGCGEAGEHGGQGGQGGEAASHDVSSFVVDLSSAAF